MADLPAMKRRVEAAAKARPGFFEARYALGRILVHEGRLEEGAAEFKAALAAKPDAEAAAVELATLRMDAEKWEEARAILAALLARNGEAREARLIAGQAAMKLV
jgi:thioredoxin-like negative regulator of GroEL